MSMSSIIVILSSMVKKIILCMVFLINTWSQAEISKGDIQIHGVVISKNQFFLGNSLIDTSSYSSLSIGILPINALNFKESIPCKSCNFFSSHNLPFLLENYLSKMVSNFSKISNQQLIAPHDELVKGHNLNLIRYIDTINFPYDKWFYGYQEPLIYREQDNFTSREIKNQLNIIGGKLDLTHLLIPTNFNLQISPKNKRSHYGTLDYSFYLILWNVVLAYPEWIIFYHEKNNSCDLDVPLNKRLNKFLSPWIADLPNKINELKTKEPR